MKMGDCFICKKPLVEDIYVAKKRAVQTLLAASVKRGCVEHQQMLESVDSVSVHNSCYKKYGNQRLASLASRRSQSPCVEPEPEQQIEWTPTFDFKNRCLFCAEIFCDESRLPVHKRKKIHSVAEKSMKENIRKYLAGRDDEFATSIVERIRCVPDLVAVGARYHRTCISHVYHALPAEAVQKGRPTGDKVDKAMEGIYLFLKENSDECQFSMNELLNQISGDFVPDMRTVKTHLKDKYGDDILINERQGRDCVVCFRNTGFKILSEKWYEEKKKDYREERLRVIREASAIIREDIRGVVYDKNNYPPSDEFVKNVEAAVPESLQVFLTTMITKDKRSALEQWTKKCTAIAHSIISAVRPRSFLSPLQIGVGTFLYKKFGSKSLINILSAMGFSATYREITIFENSCIHRAESEILENSFNQFVFDNADFNINTLDGRGTFHAMGGIQCVTPITAIQREKNIPRIVEIKSAPEVAQLGMVPVLSYSKQKSAGLKSITVADLEALRQLPNDVLPTIPDFIWLYGK